MLKAPLPRPTLPRMQVRDLGPGQEVEDHGLDHAALDHVKGHEHVVLIEGAERDEALGEHVGHGIPHHRGLGGALAHEYGVAGAIRAGARQMTTHVSIVKGGSLIDPALNVRVLTFVNPYQPDRFPP